MAGPLPQTFGKYTLLERIASGGMAEVFRAKTFGVAGFEKTVALKRILPHFAADEGFVEMFVREAKIAVRLSHANVVQVYELGRVAEDYYIALEYVDGSDLKALVKKGPLPVDLAAWIAQRICAALHHAHAAVDDAGGSLGIVHRDVSPHNVLLSWNGEVKVADFGIAKLASGVRHTRTGTVKGKLAYMSPEQSLGESDLDGRSDLFAVGIVLFEMLTGRRPFDGETDREILRKVQQDEPPPPSAMATGVPAELDAVVAKALAKRRDDRFSDGQAMGRALGLFLQRRAAESGAVVEEEDLARLMRERLGGKGAAGRRLATPREGTPILEPGAVAEEDAPRPNEVFAAAGGGRADDAARAAAGFRRDETALPTAVVPARDAGAPFAGAVPETGGHLAGARQDGASTSTGGLAADATTAPLRPDIAHRSAQGARGAVETISGVQRFDVGRGPQDLSGALRAGDRSGTHTQQATRAAAPRTPGAAATLGRGPSVTERGSGATETERLGSSATETERIASRGPSRARTLLAVAVVAAAAAALGTLAPTFVRTWRSSSTVPSTVTASGPTSAAAPAAPSASAPPAVPGAAAAAAPAAAAVPAAGRSLAGRLRIDGSPKGASIVLSGTRIGTLGSPIEGVPFGDHAVVVRSEFHRSKTVKVHLDAAAPEATLRVDLAPGVGELRVGYRPDRFTHIDIPGVTQGPSDDAWFRSARAGKHRARLTGGPTPIDVVVVIHDGKTTRLFPDRATPGARFLPDP